MRLTLRVLSVLTLLCIIGGVALILANGSTGGDMSPLILPGFGLLGLGALLTLVDAILGIVATAMRHQPGWLIAAIVAALFPLIGWLVTGLLAGVFPTVANDIENIGLPGSFLGGPVLVALVTFLYSFRMRAEITIPA